MRRLLITGTDTGVGKTQVTAAIASRLVSEGHRVAAVKPFSTGFGATSSEPSDVEILARSTGFVGKAEQLSAYRLQAPLSPLVAARREKMALSLESVRQLLDFFSADVDVLLVEGIGGLLVPLWHDYTVADMAVDLRLPALVVSRPGLGTINHTSLTIAAARARGIELTGFVMSMTEDVDAATAAENAAIVTQETGLACAGIMPVVAEQTPAGWHDAGQALNLDIAIGASTPSTTNGDEITDLDRAHVWHPFTQTAEWRDEKPLVITAGSGCWLLDSEGRRYLDGNSLLWCNVHGHRHPRITNAIHEQLERVAHTTLLGLTHEPAARLAAELVRRTPAGLTRVFYSDSGATAVEVALRLAVEQWERRGQAQRNQFVSLRGGYHGDTLGAVSVGHDDVFHRALDPLLFPVHKIDPPHLLRVRDGLSEDDARSASLKQLEKVLERNSPTIAGCIVEPRVQGAAGIWVQPEGFLTGVQEICRRHEVLLICDEVATGFGRTGDMFASLDEGVSPDLMTLGKGLTGGYLPLAATLTTEAIFETFTAPYEELSTFFYGHTFTGNPLGCAAALASLEAFDQEDTLVRGRRAGGLLREQLQPLAALPCVKDVRGRGLMFGIELCDPESGEPFPTSQRMGRQVCLAARSRGLILRPLADVVVVMPPLVISDDEIGLLTSAVADSIKSICMSNVFA